MLTLILLLLFGGVFAYFALQNPLPVTVSFAQYSASGVPLFLVILASMLVGIFLAFILYLVNQVTSTLTIRGKNRRIHEEEKEIAELTKQIHNLELENERLRKEDGQEENEKSL